MSDTKRKKPDKPEEKPFRASDVKDIAGLTYRQLHMWDSKGAVSSDRDNPKGWRRFTLREIFAVLVCAEIRKRFGVALEDLGFINSCMIREGVDHFAHAVKAMSAGLTVYLATDLKETFLMDSDRIFALYFRKGLFRGDDPESLLFIKVNPLVNRILSALREPFELKTKNDVYLLEAAVERQFIAHNKGELEVLRQLRDCAFQRVSIVTRAGEIVRIDSEEELDDSTREFVARKIRSLIEKDDYKKIELTLRDGEVMRVTAKKIRKPKK